MDITDEDIIEPLVDHSRSIPEWITRRMPEPDAPNVSQTHDAFGDDQDDCQDDVFQSESSSRDDSSLPSEEHSYGNNYEDGNDDGEECAERKTKNLAEDIFIPFEGEQLETSHAMCGFNIRRTSKEKKLLDQLEHTTSPANQTEDRDQPTVTARQMMDALDENGPSMIKCNLCRHCAIPSLNEDPQFRTAYDMMCNLDIEKYGYASDETIFIEMATLFNSEQAYIKKNGGLYFFVTAAEVRDHFVSHTINHPLRDLGTEVRVMKDILQKGKKHLMGSITGKKSKFWNDKKTKLYLACQRQFMTLNREYKQYRFHVNMQISSIKMKSAPKKDQQQSSRHLSGAVPPGRFALPYITS